MSMGQIGLGADMPVLQKTRFGWVISGSLGRTNVDTSHRFVGLCTESNCISRFWEVEEVPNSRILSKEDQICETNFMSTHKRDHEGRFVVTAALKVSISMLGDSKAIAFKRSFNLERKLEKNPTLKQMYSSFIEEYIQMGHMSKLSDMSLKSGETSYFLPHHAAMKEESTTTKLRVVFDGSCKTSSGISLNDLQLVGPTIQSDLLAILLRFRQHIFVVSADIAKMYRQVLLNPTQRNLQRIIWRFERSKPVEFFELNTITYGTASASFLATRCLAQLADEFSSQYPEACRIIKEDFFVDDLLTGSDSLADLGRYCSEIIKILNSGCFPLRKWVTNSDDIISSLSLQQDESNSVQIGESSKTLGLLWNHKSDILTYGLNLQVNAPVTKRSILSTASQIFDPLGLLSPCTIKIKILLQKLWSENLSWDESIPASLHSEWTHFIKQISALEKVQIIRPIRCKDAVRTELHGFCDASESAYGACIYVRSIDATGRVFINLLCAKSKVAPLRKITLPRLELCGAVVLAKLVSYVKKSLSIQFDNILLWSDSTIVLGWLHRSPNLLKTFVGNRVSEISSLTDINCWYHIRTKQNPADLLTRGIGPADISADALWWGRPHIFTQSLSRCQINQLNLIQIYINSNYQRLRWLLL